MADPAALTSDAKKTYFLEFLRAQEEQSIYSLKLRAMMDSKQTRLMVSINDLRNYDGALANAVLQSPIDTIPVFEAAIREAILSLDATYYDRLAEVNPAFRTVGGSLAPSAKVHLGLEGNFGENEVTPRSLSAEHINKMVAVTGIVTRCSLVRPKVVRSVHYCPATDKFDTREYRDATDFSGAPTGTVYPTKDEQNNPLETEFGLCTYKASQTVTIQEMPESAPLGQLPRSVDIYCENDLVDLVKPGDRVTVVGIYRALTGMSAQVVSGNFRTTLLGNSIHRVSREVGNVSFTAGDVSNIKTIGRRADVFDLLSRSLAPSIYGHRAIKRSLALLLVGGREHNLANGTHIRGDINILMVGDPSTAKSQLCRFVLNFAPHAINTTGRGSSGVGLTLAVTTDPDTGERRLEAGAMVLADRGVVCIDEFDKMSDADRVAIHEVMEQQTVTVAKAGIQASVNARCSVVAAANPIYGRIDNSLPLARNVALPDPLLSRFDLLWIVRDTIDDRRDAQVAGHVVRMHRYCRPGQEGIPVPLNATAADAMNEDERAEDAEADTPIFQKYNPLLHGGAAAEHEAGPEGAEEGEDLNAPLATAGAKPRRGQVELLTTEFARKYIAYAKSKMNPELTDDARAAIVEAYNSFRQRSKDRATVITTRSLETIIRLATAHAKIRLSRKVTGADVAVCRDIMEEALYGDAKAVKQEGPRSVPVGRRKVVSVVPVKKPAADGEGGGAAGGSSGGPASEADAAHGGEGVEGTGEPPAKRARLAEADSAGGAMQDDEEADVTAHFDSDDDDDEEGGDQGGDADAGATQVGGASQIRFAGATILPSAAAAEGEPLDEQDPGAPIESLATEEMAAIMKAVGTFLRNNDVAEVKHLYDFLKSPAGRSAAGAGQAAHLGRTLTRARLDAMLAALAAEDKVLVTDGIIYRIT